MTEQESENEFKRLCDILVQRGFVRRYLYDDIRQAAHFELTGAGEQLRLHLRNLFNVPNINPRKLSPDQIADLIMVILITPPPNEVR